MNKPDWFLIDGWASGRPTEIPGMLVGGSLGLLRTSSNIIQQLVVHGGTVWAGHLAFQNGLGWVELSAFAFFYIFTGLGASLGHHRLFSHQSFRPARWLHCVLAILASMCMQGSPARWATDHVRHHSYSDKAGDPHSPIVDPFGRPLGYWRGLYHAHWGWMFNGVTSDKYHFGRSTWGDPVLRFVSNFHYAWIILGLAAAWLWGWHFVGSQEAACAAMLWGGPVRAFVMMHGVLSATSIAHRIGRQQFSTGDNSRNNWLVVLLTFGDGWHNNHHKFPRSARHGMAKGQIDIAAWIIEIFERLGIVEHVVRVPAKVLDRARQESEAAQ